MKGWTGLVGRFFGPVGARSRSRRVAVGVLAAATVAACAWLLSARSPSMSVLDVPTSEVSAAVSALERQGISAEIRQGRIFVPAEQVSRARSVLRESSGGVAAAFEKLATQSDVWSSQEQQDKRWQAAKMVALGRLIEGFDGVRSATVLLEVGKGRSLGKSAGGASASVHVVTADSTQQPLGAELVQAIGELVCGSVAGLDAANVHIVDSTGRSYRALGREAMTQQELEQKHRLLQEQWIRRIRASLPEGAVSFVSVVLSEGPSPRPAAVRVSVGVERSSAASQAAVVRAVADAAGVDERAVSCDVDVAAVVAATAAPSPAEWSVESPAESVLAVWPHLIWAGPLAGFALGLAMMAWWRRGAGVSPARPAGTLPAETVPEGRTFTSQPSVSETATPYADAGGAPAPREAAAPRETPAPPRRLGVLGRLGEAELVKLLADEHPRTVAIVLAHLPSEKSAGVLAGLPAERRGQVARRVADFDRPDDEILRQVEQGLTRRLAELDTSALSADADAIRTDVPEIPGASGVDEAVRRRVTDVAELDGVSAGSLSAALAGMESRDIALALCAAPESVSRRVLGSLDSSRGRAVRAAMGRLGPMRVCDVEAAQESLVEAVRRQGGAYESRPSRPEPAGVGGA